LRKLTDWLDAYQTSGAPFPQVGESVGACRYCNFVARCDRQQQTESAPAHPSHDLSDVTATAITHRLLEQIPAVPI
jgi:hypothetical protein